MCLLSINNGYIPKIEDKIFGHGSESAKLMVKLFPSYLEKVKLLDSVGLVFGKPCEAYEEICRLSVEGGYLPDVSKMGSGYGGSTISVYNFSYDIMKKAIPIRPELIEVCRVEDKEKYDELCRLALSYGYRVPYESTLDGVGKNMCTNYDIMAGYIQEHPNYLLKVEITKPDEMLKLIEIAINSGLDLKSLSQRQLLRIFILIDESKWSDYLDSDTIEALKKTKELHTNNEEVSKTIDPKFLSDEIVSHFTKSQIEILFLPLFLRYTQNFYLPIL